MEFFDQFRISIVIGAVIHTERTARALTQQQLALMAGLHPMALSKIERGVQQDVGIETLQRLAFGLSQVGAGVTATSLVASAEQWQRRLIAEAQGGTLPVPATNNTGQVVAGVLTGAALAALLVLLASKTSK